MAGQAFRYGLGGAQLRAKFHRLGITGPRMYPMRRRWRALAIETAGLWRCRSALGHWLWGRLRLGTMVLNNDHRHPAQLAQEVATLRLLTDGRLEIGVGAGWMLADYQARGVRPEAASVRIARLAESVGTLKRLLAGDMVTRVDGHYGLERFSLWESLSEGRRPPIAIGGGSRQVLGLAGRQADIVGINLALPSGRFDAPSFLAADQEATRPQG